MILDADELVRRLPPLAEGVTAQVNPAMTPGVVLAMLQNPRLPPDRDAVIVALVGDDNEDIGEAIASMIAVAKRRGFFTTEH